MSNVALAQDTLRADFKADAVCSGSETQFIDKSYIPLGSGGIDYFWRFGDGTTSTSQFGKRKYVLDDLLVDQTYLVTLIIKTRTNPPDMDSISYNVSVYGLPNPEFDYSIKNDAVNYELFISSQATTNAAYFYQWSVGGVLKSNDITPSFKSPEIDGYLDGNTYPVTLYLISDRSCDNVKSKSLIYKAASVENEVLNRASIYPNPSKNEIHFSERVDQIKIYSSLGSLVYQNQNAGSTFQHELLPGMYSVLVEVDGKLMNQLLVVE
jgi:hypothetical protein